GTYLRSTKPRLQPGAQFAACVAFYRGELERRRRYLARPWLLGIVILVAVLQFLILMKGFHPSTRDLLSYPIALLLLILVAFPLWKAQARRLQRELDALDKFEREE